MFDIFTNLTKAVVGVATSPVTLVVDALNMPSDAWDGKDAFSRTKKQLEAVGECLDEAIKPKKD